MVDSVFGKEGPRRGAAIWLVIGILAFATVPPVEAQESETEERSAGEGEEPVEAPKGDADSDELAEPEAGRETTVELTDEQKRLNNKAIDAITGDSKSPKAAIRYLKAALMVGPKGNVLYMALGRAHQLDGDCARATEILETAVEAPQVESVPRDQVMARIEKYRGDLEATCPGMLSIECTPPSMEVTIDDESVACGDEIELSPGTYTVEATLPDVPPKTRTVEVVSMKTKRVRIEFGLSAAAESARDDLHTALSGAESAQLEAYRQAEAERLRRRARAEGGDRAEWVARRAAGIARGDESSASAPDSEAAGQQAEGGAGKARRKRSSGPHWSTKIGERLRGEVRARLPFGIYFLQLEDGDTAGGLHYGGSVVTSIGYVAPPVWVLENRIQFDWLQAFSANTDPLGIDLDTWRFQNDLRGWWSSVGLGLFIDYRHHGISIGNGDGPAEEVNSDTVAAGPSVVVSSNNPFTTDGHFRMLGRWGPLFEGQTNYFQFGLNIAAKYTEFTVEYERLTGESAPDEPLRRGELLMFHFGARLTL